MTLQQLRYAITIADSTSMNEAAKQLFISQPSLSSSIRDLEEELGMELFIRSSRGITLTPEGNEICRLCKTGHGTVPPDGGTLH